jgi:hypothetical protein
MANRVGLMAVLAASIAWGPPGAAVAAADAAPQNLAELAQDLVLELIEHGPGELWTMHVTNTGKLPVGIVADPALLWFEVAVPGRALTVVCRLPSPLWPKSIRQRAVTQLKPEERFSRRFDARFFCFDDMRQSVLVVGARVTPHFGWALETKETRVKGKRTRVTLPPRAPFVAWSVPASAAEDEAPAAAPESAPPVDPETEGAALVDPGAIALESDEPEPWDEPKEGLKSISGAAIVLAPEYAVWSPPKTTTDAEGPHLHMRAGSDAEDERGALVTIALSNGSSHSEQIFLRRDLVTYHVKGPDGVFECAPNEIGSPDFASFTTLAPKSSEPMVVRLLEMCPRSALARPGLYEIRASFVSRWSGQALGLDAFVGTLETEHPALLRIRSGEQPSFLRAAPLMATPAAGMVNPNMGPPPEGAAPADGSEAPAEEAPPADHQAPMEAPAPEAPADGTTVE